MKSLTISFLILITSLLPADETCSDCSDCERFVAFMDAGKGYMKNGDYYEALREFQAAQVAARVCGCTSTKPADLIKEAINGLQKQKEDAIRLAKENEIQKNRAIKLAKENEIQKKRAEAKAEESFLAAREARANLNALTAKDLAEKDPTKALRLAEMNHHLYPNSKKAADVLTELLQYPIINYKKIYKKGHTAGVTTVAFSPDGKNVLTGSRDKTAILWDLQGNPLQKVLGHSSHVYAITFAPTNNTVLSVSIPVVNSGGFGKILNTLLPWAYLEQKVAKFSLGELKTFGLQYTQEDVELMKQDKDRMELWKVLEY